MGACAKIIEKDAVKLGVIKEESRTSRSFQLAPKCPDQTANSQPNVASEKTQSDKAGQTLVVDGISGDIKKGEPQGEHQDTKAGNLIALRLTN
jgi:hypothetical protein